MTMKPQPSLFYLPALLLALVRTVCLGADPLDEWQWRNPLPNGNVFNGITYADGRFVAVGNGGWLAASSNGLAWAESESTPQTTRRRAGGSGR